ncbi:MAG: hypothetical protein LBE91_18995 [Tannerella sp.]|jgi:hypothetical protein|nr:hypothetical protein [Tannerella sp.]
MELCNIVHGVVRGHGTFNADRHLRLLRILYRIGAPVSLEAEANYTMVKYP